MAHSIAREVRTHLLSGERQLYSLAEMVDGEVSGIQTQTLLDAGCGQGEFFESVLLVSEDGIVENVGLPVSSRSKRRICSGSIYPVNPSCRTRIGERRGLLSRVFLYGQ